MKQAVGSRRLSALLASSVFVVRHFLWVGLAVGLGCVFWTVVYGLLVGVAIVTGQGLGGPLAYPAGLAVIVVGGVVCGWGIFAPASAVGALFCRWCGLSRVWAIPVVFLVGFFLSYLVFLGYAGVSGAEPPTVLKSFERFAVFLSFPLGGYWWLTEGTGLFFDWVRGWVERFLFGNG